MILFLKVGRASIYLIGRKECAAERTYELDTSYWQSDVGGTNLDASSEYYAFYLGLLLFFLILIIFVFPL